MAKMVDVGRKPVVRREATAVGRIVLKQSTCDTILQDKIKKGDVMSASKLAGIQAAKATYPILPLCHQIPLTFVGVDMSLKDGAMEAECTVRAEYRTGVEMEALVGVTVALLNAWDMVKYLEKDSKGQYPTARIDDVRVLRKTKDG